VSEVWRQGEAVGDPAPAAQLAVGQGKAVERVSGYAMQIVGVTVDGRPVLRGALFDLHDTYGLPIPHLLFELKRSYIQPDWEWWFGEALYRGWSPKTIVSRFRWAISDVYGPAYAAVVLAALLPEVAGSLTPEILHLAQSERSQWEQPPENG